MIHFAVKQKLTPQHCKSTILQQKLKKKKSGLPWWRSG